MPWICPTVDDCTAETPVDWIEALGRHYTNSSRSLYPPTPEELLAELAKLEATLKGAP